MDPSIELNQQIQQTGVSPIRRVEEHKRYEWRKYVFSSYMWHEGRNVFMYIVLPSNYNNNPFIIF